MLSPSPTQQPPVPEPKPEEKKVVSSSKKKRAGETPAALAVKAVVRPIIKVFYYLFRFVGKHKLLSLTMIVLFIGGIVGTNILLTHSLPFGIGDPFSGIATHDSASAANIRNWLYAVRDGDVNKLNRLEAQMLKTSKSPPDATQLVKSYSQPETGMTWKSINIIGVYGEVDTSLDSFIEVDLTLPGSQGNAILIWHFTTIPQLQGGVVFVDIVTFHQTFI